MPGAEHIEFLVEGYSMKVTLEHLSARLLPKGVTSEVHDLGSKSEFLKKLPNRLKGYSTWLPEAHRIVLVIDSDADDCGEIRQLLVDHVARSGLSVASVSAGRDGQVLPRIAVEMLEAWFFGDLQAVADAYGSHLSSLGQRRGYREPDKIRDPARRLGVLLRKSPGHAAGLRKLVLADDVAKRMNPEVNTSTSFCRLRDGVRFLSKSA